MKKWFVLILLCTLALGAFAGGQTGGGEVEAQTLRVASPPWIFKKFDLETYCDRFESDHPEITVERIRADKWGGVTYIPEWEAGESSFDVFVGGSGSMLAPLIVGGWTEPMGGMLTGNMAPDKLVGGFLAAGMYKKDGGGSYYPVLPFMGEVAIIGVNTNILKDSGLWSGDKPVPIPSMNQGEFVGWFAKMKDNAPVGAHVQIWDREFMQYDYCSGIQAQNGTFLAKDGKGFDLSSAAAKKWLGLLQTLYREGLAAYPISDDKGYELWKSGAAGSFFAAQGHVMELPSVTGRNEDIAYTGWPGSDKNGSIIWTHSVWMPKVVKNKDVCRMFIREQVFHKDFGQWSFNNWGKLPIVKEAYGAGITRFQDQMPVILSIADASGPIPLYKDLDKYLDILQKYLTEAAFDRMSVDEALDSVKSEIQDLDFTDVRAY